MDSHNVSAPSISILFSQEHDSNQSITRSSSRQHTSDCITQSTTNTINTNSMPTSNKSLISLPNIKELIIKKILFNNIDSNTTIPVRKILQLLIQIDLVVWTL